MKRTVGNVTGGVLAALLTTATALTALPSTTLAQSAPATQAQSDAQPVLIIRRIEPTRQVEAPAITFVRTLTPTAPAAPAVIIARTIEPRPTVDAAPAAPTLDEAAIAARDGRMLDSLTRQSIAAIIGSGLENDGETTSGEREAVEAFYASRDHKPLFTSAGDLNALGASIRELFETADAYGLNAGDFAHDAFLSSDARHRMPAPRRKPTSPWPFGPCAMRATPRPAA